MTANYLSPVQKPRRWRSTLSSSSCCFFFYLFVLYFCTADHICCAQLPLDMLRFKLYTVRDAVARNAVCNDGTPAKYYFRDCPRPGAECLLAPSAWLVVFGGGSSADTCYDAASCEARSAKYPERMTSSMLNATLDPVRDGAGGIFSSSGEENPNFYQQVNVYVPYCSSDMWAGNSTTTTTTTTTTTAVEEQQQQQRHFRGRSIARAVLEDLAALTFTPVSIPTPYGPGPNNTKLTKADSIALAGGAGIMAEFRELSQVIPRKPGAKLRAICDNCLVPELVTTTKRSAAVTDTTTAATAATTTVAPAAAAAAECLPGAASSECAPPLVLKQGMKLWDPAAGATTAWRMLLAPASLNAVGQVPLLVIHPQWDRSQLQQWGAWPPPPATAAAAEISSFSGPATTTTIKASNFAAAVRKIMSNRPHQGLFTFSPACTFTTSTGALYGKTSFFCRPTPCKLMQANQTQTLKLSVVTSMFLKDGGKMYSPACIDTCTHANCNPYCSTPDCFGV